MEFAMMGSFSEVDILDIRNGCEFGLFQKDSGKPGLV